MSVSGELLCSFELLKPLESSQLKSHMKKGKNERQRMLNSPVSIYVWSSPVRNRADNSTACKSVSAELLIAQLCESIQTNAKSEYINALQYHPYVIRITYLTGFYGNIDARRGSSGWMHRAHFLS